MLHYLTTVVESEVLFIKIILGMETASEADNLDFKEEQNKNNLKLGHH